VRIEMCSIGVVMVDGQFFTVTATGLVVLRHGTTHGTTATLSDARSQLRGTQLLFSDAGYPVPQGR
jgi:hypothetical protein